MDIHREKFESGRPGVRLVVFGAIHGNEPCGPQAMDRIANRIRRGELSVETGSLLLIPGANPEAFRQGVRQTEENLNRVFKKTDNPQSYEARVANELCALLDTEADMLLDVHSTSAPGPMSVFADHPSDTILSYAEALGPDYIILDWPLVYANNPHGFTSSCTSDYAHEINIPGVTVECGQHADPASIEVAEKAVIRACIYAGIMHGDLPQGPKPKKIYMRTLEQKKDGGDSLSREWKHLEPIQAGEHIATLTSGEKVYAKEACVMILPKHHAQKGEEWYYLGVLG